ncbi:MAG TPA: hypothetical protein VIN05_06745 [Roseovarius sp.]
MLIILPVCYVFFNASCAVYSSRAHDKSGLLIGPRKSACARPAVLIADSVQSALSRRRNNYGLNNLAESRNYSEMYLSSIAGRSRWASSMIRSPGRADISAVPIEGNEELEAGAD